MLATAATSPDQPPLASPGSLVRVCLVPAACKRPEPSEAITNSEASYGVREVPSTGATPGAGTCPQYRHTVSSSDTGRSRCLDTTPMSNSAARCSCHAANWPAVTVPAFAVVQFSPLSVTYESQAARGDVVGLIEVAGADGSAESSATALGAVWTPDSFPDGGVAFPDGRVNVTATTAPMMTRVAMAATLRAMACRCLPGHPGDRDPGAQLPAPWMQLLRAPSNPFSI